MSEQGNRTIALTPWILLILLLLTLFAMSAVTRSELRDLQRRVAELEQRK